uniref:Uncharacterized protein n=1 Tax=Romanomermis culicivorax TaxID=13658 RepID=A0A915IUF5_ROMCU
MAKPTSAFFNAGPSLVPSPVTATTSRCLDNLLSIIPRTRTNLSEGEERAKTRNFGQTWSNSSCWIIPSSSLSSKILRAHFEVWPLKSYLILLLNSGPSKTIKSADGLIIPHCVAIDLAVCKLSPVTIRTVMPAF